MENESSDFLMVPHERIGAIIGKNGETKREIETITKTKIEIDSKEGSVEITQKGAPYEYLKAFRIIKAIARGFSPEKSFRLLDDDCMFELIELRDILGKNQSMLTAKKGRVIGNQGKARDEIERDTGANISVYGKTIAIIGKEEEVAAARKAIDMLLHGASHTAVYDSLKRKKINDKFEL